MTDIHLQSQEIVFTTSDDSRRETFPEVVSNLSRAGIKPLLVTNAGIYGTDNRPLGLLISPKGKLHDVNTSRDRARARKLFMGQRGVPNFRRRHSLHCACTQLAG